jgi:hypothetical protein
MNIMLHRVGCFQVRLMPTLPYLNCKICGNSQGVLWLYNVFPWNSFWMFLESEPGWISLVCLHIRGHFIAAGPTDSAQCYCDLPIAFVQTQLHRAWRTKFNSNRTQMLMDCTKWNLTKVILAALRRRTKMSEQWILPRMDSQMRHDSFAGRELKNVSAARNSNVASHGRSMSAVATAPDRLCVILIGMDKWLCVSWSENIF